MRTLFWGMYQDIAFKKFYWEEHQRRSEKLLFTARLLCAAVSIVSVLIWSIAKSMPALWASLIALAQIAQSMLDSLPWAKQLTALQYLIPELSDLLVDIDKDWMVLERIGADENDTIEKIHAYEQSYYRLENQYASGVWFPTVKSVVAAAEEASDAYFRLRYFMPEGTDNSGPEKGQNEEHSTTSTERRDSE